MSVLRTGRRRMIMSKWLWDKNKNRKCGRKQNRYGNKFNNFGVLHTTENNLEGSARAVANWQNSQKKVYSGYHYLIDTNEIVYQCNPLTTRANHAGKSYNWGGAIGGGNLGIGASMVARAGLMPYTSEKDNFNKLIDNTAKLMVALEEKFNIPLKKITIEEYRDGVKGWLGHQDVAYRLDKLGRKKQRKFDPGAKFPWDVLIARAVSIKNQHRVPDTRKESKVEMLQDTGPTPVEVYNHKSAQQLLSVGATENSEKYALLFYRTIAEELGLNGSKPKQVAHALLDKIGR